MSIQCIILLIILFVLSISTCRSNNFEEFGHDFQAYPSYLESFIEGNNIQDEIIHYFNNIKKVENKVKLIDVSSFGANGDGKTDDTRAFEQAWKEACSSNTPVNFVVQHNKNYLLKNMHFF
ncbi:polygalacturonase-2 isoform X1 [Capsicum annuum]